MFFFQLFHTIKQNANSLWFKLRPTLFTFCKILIVSMMISNFTFAQTVEVDSLRALLSQSSRDSERISLMLDLSTLLYSINIDQARVYAQKALSLSQKTKDKELEAKAMFNLGILIYETPERDSALLFFNESEKIAAQLNLKHLQADNLMRIAKWYRYHVIDSTLTVQYLNRSISVSKAGNYDYGVGRSYAKLASFYARFNQISLSEEYLELSAEYYMRLDYGGEEVAHYYNEVGNKIWDFNPKKSMELYLKGMKYSDTYPNIKVNLAKAYNLIGEPETALYYLEEAIPNINEMKYTRMLGIAKALLAEVYIQLKEYNKAILTCDEGIVFLTPLGRSDQRALPDLYRAKAKATELIGKPNSALVFYERSLTEANRIDYEFGSVKSELALGKFYAFKDPIKGKYYCEKALKRASAKNYTNLEIEAYDCLSAINKKEKNFSLALEYYEQKIILSDSLSTFKLEHAIDISQKIAQKDKLLAEESYQKELKEEQLNNQARLNNILLIFSFIGLFLIAFLLFSLSKITKQNAEIQIKTRELEEANINLIKSNEDLERFAHVASHDLKSPLNNIIGFSGLLRKKLGDETNPMVKKSLDFIESSGKRMQQLIEDILQYSKLSSQDNDKEKTDIVNLNEVVNEIAVMISGHQKDKIVSIEASELPKIEWSSSKIFLLLKNLIENGLKYNQSEVPMVSVSYVNLNGINTLYIQDNGIGIKKENFDKIFVMFQRLHTQKEFEGTGLGLATCKKIVDEFKGDISVESEEGKGTLFKIIIPIHLISWV